MSIVGSYDKGKTLFSFVFVQIQKMSIIFIQGTGLRKFVDCVRWSLSVVWFGSAKVQQPWTCGCIASGFKRTIRGSVRWKGLADATEAEQPEILDKRDVARRDMRCRRI